MTLQTVFLVIMLAAWLLAWYLYAFGGSLQDQSFLQFIAIMNALFFLDTAK